VSTPSRRVAIKSVVPVSISCGSSTVVIAVPFDQLSLCAYGDGYAGWP
jgi:hypothetical protein